jgi:modification methylase
LRSAPARSASKAGNGKKLHPTQKPEALLARVLLASSRPDDLVLDPFCGTGTTGAVAKRFGRRFVGIERDAGYAAAAQARIASVAPMPEQALAPFQTAREAPRVPFSALIERGMVMPGARLCDAKRKVKALVRADGAIALGDTVGSIHRIGALAQGLEACNGWAFWHLETTKGLVSIDALARGDQGTDGTRADLQMRPGRRSPLRSFTAPRKANCTAVRTARRPRWVCTGLR